jgi:adenosylcobyric acid synthase
MDWLQARTGVPTVAIIPMVRHALPEEDTLHHRAEAVSGQINIALLAYPYASNLDEFDPLVHEDGVNLVPIRDFERLECYHAIILPGSKNTVESLRYLRQSGLAAEVSRAAQKGIPVLGICGGLQMLGQCILDPGGLESGDMFGLGLLDVETTLMLHKITRQREARVIGGELVKGYEIHHGQTQAGPHAHPYLEDSLGWRQGNVWGVYLHGLFEDTGFRQEFLVRLGWQGQSRDWDAFLDSQLNNIAHVITESGWQP